MHLLFGTKYRVLCLLAVAGCSVAALSYAGWRHQRLHARVFRAGFINQGGRVGPEATGKPNEFGIRILTEAARRAELSLAWVYSPEGAEAALRSGRVDLWPYLFNQEQLKPAVYFRRPFLQAPLAILRQEPPPLARGPGTRITIPGGEIQSYMASRLFPRATFLRHDQEGDLLATLCAGKAEAALVGRGRLALLAEMWSRICPAPQPRAVPVSSGELEISIASTPAASFAADALRDALDSYFAEQPLEQLLAGYYLETAVIAVPERSRGTLEQVWRWPWTGWWAATLLALAATLEYNRVRAENGMLRRGLAERDRLLAEMRQTGDGKAQFVANISHELCTPMNGILGALDLLQETRLASGQRELLNMATGSGRGLYALIRRLVDYAQMDQGQLPFEERPFSLQEIVEKLAQSACAEAESRGVAFTLRIDPAAPDWLAGDPRQVHGILECLLQNAVKFTTAGRVTLRLLPATPATRGALRVEIIDTGPGIAPVEQERIFTAFAQVDGSMTRAFGGLGIGLAVALRAARRMGGRIELESTLGTGSRFTLFLPAAMRCPAPSGQTHSRRERPGELPRRAVVIHSDAETRQALEETIAATGMQVLTLDHIPAGGVMDDSASHIFVEESQLETAPTSWPRQARLISLSARQARRPAGIPGRGYFELPSPFLPAEIRHVLRGGSFATPSPGTSPPRADGAGLGMRILLVDDSATNRKIAELLLLRLGCSVQTAENGQLALDLLARQQALPLPFDLVLMDCQMPVLDGYEATRRLRASGDRTPVVALTAQIGPGESVQCGQAGMDDYLTKPLSRQALVRVLQRFAAPTLEARGASDLDSCIVPMHDMPQSGHPNGAVDA